eukprot:3058974-Rhodomonas_salina.1
MSQDVPIEVAALLQRPTFFPSFFFFLRGADEGRGVQVGRLPWMKVSKFTDPNTILPFALQIHSSGGATPVTDKVDPRRPTRLLCEARC